MHHAHNTWQPGPAELAESGVARLVRALGVADYDELLAVSVAEPARYWDVATRFCDIAWTQPPRGHVDLSQGREFPRWFPGARLNWVDTVLAWSRRPATAGRDAVVAEREDGSIATVSWADLPARVGEIAAGLAALGVQPGDRVGLLMDNGVEATLSVLAIVSLGALVVPLFSGFGADPIVARLGAAEAGMLLATTGFWRRGKWVDMQAVVREARTKLPALRLVVWKHRDEPPTLQAGESTWQALQQSARGRALAPVPMAPDDPFMVIYTSGTTGKPKGVVHSHGGFPIKIAHDAVAHFDVRPGDVFSWPADMGWIAGTLVLCCALLRGATLVCYDGAPDVPDWGRMSRLVERHRITHLGSAPTLIRGMASHEAQALAGDRSTLRLLITAGENIAPEHFTWFQHRFGGGAVPLINYTGGTEASGALLASVVVRPIPPAGFNSASPGVAVDVADASGRSLTGAVGEVVVREPFIGMTQSFWKDDERYLDTYWRTTPGLWVHGDLALRRAEDGVFFMMGRSDDTLKVAGKRLGPAEVEEVVLEVTGVAEAAAIGVDDPDKGQKLVVFIVARPQDGAPLAGALEAQVMQHVDRRLGRPFRPAAVHAVAQLPKTRSSKIMRRVIRSAYCNLPAGDLSSLDNPGALDAIRHAAGAS